MAPRHISRWAQLPVGPPRHGQRGLRRTLPRRRAVSELEVVVVVAVEPVQALVSHAYMISVMYESKVCSLPFIKSIYPSTICLFSAILSLHCLNFNHRKYFLTK